MDKECTIQKGAFENLFLLSKLWCGPHYSIKFCLQSTIFFCPQTIPFCMQIKGSCQKKCPQKWKNSLIFSTTPCPPHRQWARMWHFGKCGTACIRYRTLAVGAAFKIKIGKSREFQKNSLYISNEDISSPKVFSKKSF